MRKRLISLVATGAMVAGSMVAVAEEDTKASTFTEKNDIISYTIGFRVGNNLKSQSIDIQDEALFAGIRDAVKGNKSAVDMAEADKFIKELQAEIRTKRKAEMAEKAETNLKAGTAFLEKNKAEKDVVTLDSGLQYQVIEEGDGTTPKETDTVVTHYKGTFIDGSTFDSSYDRGKPAHFPVNGVIKGWTEALQMMKVGSKWRLFVPPELAYGEVGAGNSIPPNSTLIFDIELLAIK